MGNGDVKAYAVSEHVEKGGTHSGDATLMLPSQSLDDATMKRIKDDTFKIAKELEISGPFNTQFLVKDDWVGVIETNLRASRSMPFVSKVYDVPFIKMATKIMLGEDVDFNEKCEREIDHVAVKSPQFSFKRLLGADPALGVEMSSTGEVACFGRSVEEAFLKSILAAGFNLPSAGSNVAIALPKEPTSDHIQAASDLVDLGFSIFATDEHTSAALSSAGIKTARDLNGDLNAIADREVELVLELGKDASGYRLRRDTIDFALPLITDIEQTKLLVRAFQQKPTLEPASHDEYFEASEYWGSD